MIRSPRTPEEWDHYFDLRYRVLREPWKQVRGSERNDGDAQAEHFAYFQKNQLVGVSRLDVMSPKQCQIRFMAVDHMNQGTGIGKALMLHMEQRAWEHGVQEIILHAREVAIPFYTNLGYMIIKKSHLLYGEIQHYLMSKQRVK
jgi:N-acetylglutamate synthase-like GNAT family acetyltransferase